MSRVLSNLGKKGPSLSLAYVGSPCLSPRRGEVSRSDGEGPLFGNNVDHWSALRWTIMLPERIRRNMRNARAKGIAALRCRWQIQQGRNFRSGRKTRGAAQARSVFRVPQGGSADHRPRLTIFPQTFFGIIRSIRTARSISPN